MLRIGGRAFLHKPAKWGNKGMTEVVLLDGNGRMDALSLCKADERRRGRRGRGREVGEMRWVQTPVNPPIRGIPGAEDSRRLHGGVIKGMTRWWHYSASCLCLPLMGWGATETVHRATCTTTHAPPVSGGTSGQIPQLMQATQDSGARIGYLLR